MRFTRQIRLILLASLGLMAVAAFATPTITPSLPKRWVASGGTINLSFKVTDDFPVGFQWYQNGFPVPNATNAIYGITNAQSGETGLYLLIATNSEGQSACASVRLNVIAFPTSLVAWGDNTLGQLNVPPFLNDPGNGTNGIVAVSAAGATTYALRADGTVVCWGTYSNPPPVGLTNVVQIAAAGPCCMALRSDGTVVVWVNTIYNDGQDQVPPNLTNVVAISAEDSRCLALKDDGSIVIWGNAFAHYWPDGSRATAIASAAQYSIALKPDNTVMAWGDPIFAGVRVPTDLSNVVALGSCQTGNHSMALQNDGTVRAWGSNIYGQTNVPAGLSRVIGVFGGKQNSLALKSDGTLVSWGTAYGKNIITNYVVGVPDGVSNVVDAAAGSYHNVAVVQGPLPQGLGQLAGEFVAGRFQIKVPGIINQAFTIHVSHDLIHWAPMTSNFVAIGTMLIDNESTNSIRRFYRMVPNP